MTAGQLAYVAFLLLLTALAAAVGLAAYLLVQDVTEAIARVIA